MPYLDELRQKLRLEVGDPITEDWYEYLVEYLEKIEKGSAVDYIGYVHRDIIPEKDSFINIGVKNLRFKQVHSVYGYFSYVKSDTITFHNVAGDIIPEKDALFNIGVENLRFKQAHSVYGYFSYVKSDTIIFHNISGDYGEFNELSFSSVIPVKKIVSDYIANCGEIVLVDASSQQVTVTLPTPKRGCWVVVKKIDSSTNYVIVDGAGATIDGSATLTISTQYESYILVSDGYDWYIIAKNV